MNKHVLIRADLDVPLSNKKVLDDYRLKSLLPTLKTHLKNSEKLLIIGHQGRPTRKNTKNSLLPIKKELERLVHQPISLISDPEGVGEWQKNSLPIGLLENLRFFAGENAQNTSFARTICQGSDLYIYESFAHFHPSASIQTIPEILPTETGSRFDLEVNTLSDIRKNKDRSNLLIISGVKKDKFKVVEKLTKVFDTILIGGHLASQTLPPSLESSPNVKKLTLTPNGLDLDKKAVADIKRHVLQASTVVLNGPLGNFELEPNHQSTQEILAFLKSSSVFTVLGGGDTLNAMRTLGFDSADFSFVSTGGGSMLNFLSTGTHPLLKVLS
jgi:phosphoglycerate kinase